MRLLPDQEGAHRRGALLPFVVGHLLPSHSLIALSLGNVLRFIKYFCIPLQAPLEQGGPAPEGKMHRMPPMHLEVGLAIPAVVGESSLLRWIIAGALDPRQILRQDDPPFQLECPLVFASRK